MHVYALIGLLAASSVQGKNNSRDTPCPPWFISYANCTATITTEKYSHCICSPYLAFRITCQQMEHTSYLKLGNCAFYNNVTGDTIVGACPYIFPEHLFVNQFLKLPQNVNKLNSAICSNLTREVGQSMCGRCINGTGPSVTSVGSQCVECRAVNVLYYILLRYLPATIIFLVILSLQVNVVLAPMAHSILYCNILIFNMQSYFGLFTMLSFSENYYKFIMKALLSLNTIWSFEPLLFLSPPLCFSTHIDEIDILYFEILANLYPFLLLLVAYVVIELHARGFKPVVFLWRPLHQSFICWRRSWNPTASLVQSFATIFFFSYAKLLFLVDIPLRHTDFINQHGKIIHGLTATYIDPTVHYGDRQHIYLLGSSAAILIFIILPPILILMAYPTRLFRRLQNRLSSRVNLAIDTFVSTFQGCYKDGLNGTRDYRAMSGGILAIFVVVMIVKYICSMLVEVRDRQPIILGQLTILILIALTVLMAVLKPYKSEFANHTGVCLTALLAAGATLYLFLSVNARHVEMAIYVGVALLTLPHLVFYGYFILRILAKFDLKVVTRVCCRTKTTVPEEQALIN